MPPEEGTGPPAIASVGRLLHPLRTAKAARCRDTLHEACASEGLLNALGVAVGDWVAVFRRAADDELDPCLVQLVPAGEGAIICQASPPHQGASANVLYLPANLLELLGATPGRSSITVARCAAAAGSPPFAGPPLASRVVLSRVQTPQGRRRFQRALRSFFAVPRILSEGEVFGVPPQGLPPRLGDAEGAAGGPSVAGDGGNSSEEEDAGDPPGDPIDGPDQPSEYRSGIAVGAEDAFDPLGGFAFCDLLSFRVERIEERSSPSSPPRSQSRRPCLRVDRQQTEVVVQGTCQARAVPYMANHLFCAGPAVLPATLQEPCARLLGALAPAVRAWAQRRGPLPGRAVAPHAVLVAGARGCGKRLLWRAVCGRLGLHLLEVNCYQLVSRNPGAVEEALQQLIADVVASSPTVLCLRRLKALAAAGPAQSPATVLLLQRRLEAAIAGALRRARTEGDGGGGVLPLLVLAGTCEDLEEIGGPVRKSFQVELVLERPNAEARRGAIAQVFRAYADTVGPEEAAPKTADVGALVDEMVKLTAGLSYTDLRSVCGEVAAGNGFRVPEDAAPEVVERVEKAVKRLQGGSKVAVTLASKVQWADVGGLQHAKQEIIDCITLPLSQGQMFDGEKVRSGVLLFGPPGTGKTLLAKAVATECKVHFLSVKGPELLSMYIGESERNVRELFQKARELAPCVLFFDELDALAPARGRGSDSGGVMDRVVSQLITELDTMPSTVFLVGATNRPDLLDRSLLRPGRLDRAVYLGIAPEKSPLLRAITRKFHLDETAADAADGGLLEAVARGCPPNLTGADVSVLCADAYTQAQTEQIGLLHEVASGVKVSITTLLLFLEALEREDPQQGAHDAAVPTSNAFSLLFPRSAAAPTSAGGGASGAGGLLLFEAGLSWKGSFVLAHHSGTPAAAVVFVQGDQDESEVSGVPAGFDDAWRDFAAAFIPCGTGVAKGSVTAVRGLSPRSALRVRVGRRHFMGALARLQPSVSMQDLARYEQLAKEYQNTK